MCSFSLYASILYANSMITRGVLPVEVSVGRYLIFSIFSVFEPCVLHLQDTCTSNSHPAWEKGYMCQKCNTFQPVHLELWKLPVQLSGSPGKIGYIFSTVPNTNNWQAAFTSQMEAERVQEHCFQRLFTSLLSPCSVTLQCFTLPGIKRRHNIYAWISRAQKTKLSLFSCFGSLQTKWLRKDKRWRWLKWHHHWCGGPGMCPPPKKPSCFLQCLDIKWVWRRKAFRKLLYLFFLQLILTLTLSLKWHKGLNSRSFNFFFRY